MTKEIMIKTLAEVALKKDVFEYWASIETEEDIIKHLSLSDEIDTVIEYAFGETDSYTVNVIENTVDYAEDNERIHLIFKFENKANADEGYLKFSGRYSSWDSSYFNEVQVVYPVEVRRIQYLTKLEKGDNR